MNGNPHTHRVQIDREYGTSGGHVLVTYGDTTVSTRRWWQLPGCFQSNNPSDASIQRAIKKAVRLHDEGSKRAAAHETAMNALRASVAQLPQDVWASEALDD